MTRLLITTLALLISTAAAAEKNEHAIGIDGGVMFPSFSSPSPTAFALASWELGGTAEYGITHDLFVQAGFRFASFSGQATEHTVIWDKRSYTGDLGFLGRFYHPEVGFRYKLFSGYNLAPHLLLRGGYLWAAYHNTTFTTPDGLDYGLNTGDFAEGAVTGSVGLVIDYRLANVAFVGVAIKYTKLFGDSLFNHSIAAPITVSYYW